MHSALAPEAHQIVLPGKALVLRPRSSNNCPVGIHRTPPRTLSCPGRRIDRRRKEPLPAYRPDSRSQACTARLSSRWSSHGTACPQSRAASTPGQTARAQSCPRPPPPGTCTERSSPPPQGSDQMLRLGGC
eukprot:7380180-Prymnesium_polylepis.1